MSTRPQPARSAYAFVSERFSAKDRELSPMEIANSLGNVHAVLLEEMRPRLQHIRDGKRELVLAAAIEDASALRDVQAVSRDEYEDIIATMKELLGSDRISHDGRDRVRGRIESIKQRATATPFGVGFADVVRDSVDRAFSNSGSVIPHVDGIVAGADAGGLLGGLRLGVAAGGHPILTILIGVLGAAVCSGAAAL